MAFLFFGGEDKRERFRILLRDSCKDLGIAGLAEVVKEGYVDHTQFEPESKYYDPKSTEDKPRWIMVDIHFKQKFDKILPLKDIKNKPEISELGLIKKGHRLSIMPVMQNEFEWLLRKCQR